jgi:hypothetical protein
MCGSNDEIHDESLPNDPSPQIERHAKRNQGAHAAPLARVQSLKNREKFQAKRVSPLKASPSITLQKDHIRGNIFRNSQAGFKFRQKPKHSSPIGSVSQFHQVSLSAISN